MVSILLKSTLLLYFKILFSCVESYYELYDNEIAFKSLSKHRFNFADIETGPCNIPIVNEPITTSEFLKKYAYSTPVVFRRFDPDRNKLFKEKCEIDNLNIEYGHK